MKKRVRSKNKKKKKKEAKEIEGLSSAGGIGGKPPNIFKNKVKRKRKTPHIKRGEKGEGGERSN